MHNSDCDIHRTAMEGGITAGEGGNTAVGDGVDHLVRCEQLKVVWRVGDNVSFGGRVLCDVTHGVSKPIQSDAQDSVRPQRVRK